MERLTRQSSGPAQTVVVAHEAPRQGGEVVVGARGLGRERGLGGLQRADGAAHPSATSAAGTCR